MTEATHNEKEAHWENVYRTKSESEVSWYQGSLALSLDLIRELAEPENRIIDVGGGASILANRLVRLGFDHVAVMDISEIAIERAKARSAATAEKIRWIVADVTATADVGQFDIWHDRAVFHFLIEPAARKKYVDLLQRTVPPGGHAVIATFAMDGPAKCSGLDVRRYDGPSLVVELGPAFALLKTVPEIHLTPWGKPQSFQYSVFRRL